MKHQTGTPMQLSRAPRLIRSDSEQKRYEVERARLRAIRLAKDREAEQFALLSTERFKIDPDKPL